MARGCPTEPGDRSGAALLDTGWIAFEESDFSALSDSSGGRQPLPVGFDDLRRVLICDLWGCWKELQIPSDDPRPLRIVARNAGWTYVDRHDLYRCPDHPYRELWEQRG